MQTTSPAIEALGLAKRFGNTTALASFSMSVPRGEIFGFLGPNGAGKTTAVKLLLGLTRPTAGEGAVLGSPLGDLDARKQVGYLPELFRYQDWLSAKEVLGLHCALARIPRAQRRAEIDAALEIVGLRERGDDRVGTFSKGMQQRLGLGVALLGKPELVFLDEPTSALDPIGRHDVRAIILDLKARGATVFLNSHLLTEVEKVCDRAAIIDRGRVIALGTLDDLLEPSDMLRLRLAPCDDAAQKVLRAFGTPTTTDGWTTLRGISDAAVPKLVAQLVAAGINVYAVEPNRQTLEERFLQLLRRAPDVAADDLISRAR